MNAVMKKKEEIKDAMAFVRAGGSAGQVSDAQN
jgi:hypothetical protein